MQGRRWRLGVAIAKYWNNKRRPLVVAEAMEALGGAGYIEASVMPSAVQRGAPQRHLGGLWQCDLPGHPQDHPAPA